MHNATAIINGGGKDPSVCTSDTICRRPSATVAPPAAPPPPLSHPHTWLYHQ